MPEDRENGLPPLLGDNPVVLILGSFPSKMSLDRKLYYANPQNQFWRIMAALFSFGNPGVIEVNSELLKLHHIAVWDVIASRKFQPGSMDRDISDPEMNDIAGFIRNHPSIRFIGLNGGKAGECFRKLEHKVTIPDSLMIQVLPSTSPANATATLQRKREQWKIILDYLS
ncbi:MAG: DNA-deoxyinosine glycosylase [Methanoregulaceae archaeon]|nr:DNA-deoxyinosine glycosylase [Methanoregulaceae archaeon]